MKQQEPQQGRRDRMIGVKVTDEEYERVRVMAFEARKSLGAFIRDRVLGTTKRSK
jgi:hypothetical protein